MSTQGKGRENATLPLGAAQLHIKRANSLDIELRRARRGDRHSTRPFMILQAVEP